MHIFFRENKKKLLVVRRVDFAWFAKVHLLFKANSPVQHKQGLLKTFSSKTIAMTFDVFCGPCSPLLFDHYVLQYFFPFLKGPVPGAPALEFMASSSKLLYSVRYNKKNFMAFILA